MLAAATTAQNRGRFFGGESIGVMEEGAATMSRGTCREVPPQSFMTRWKKAT